MHRVCSVGSEGYKLSIGRFSEPRMNPPYAELAHSDISIWRVELATYRAVVPSKVYYEKVFARLLALIDPS